jgi:soluble lytic murein transglycosylase
MRHVAMLGLLALVPGLACTRAEPRGNTLAHNGSATASSPAPTPSTSTTAPPVAYDIAWVEAVRLEDWHLAASLLDALPEPSLHPPQMRYVRARVALAQKDWQRALTLMEGLEQPLPALAADLALHRAEAHLHGGHPDQAAQHFAQAKSVRALTKASLAFSRAGNPKQARSTIDRAIQIAGTKINDDTVEARHHRATLAQTTGDLPTAIADLRFVSRHAQDPKTAHTASALLAQIDPNHRLTSAEHMDRAWTHANRGHADHAIEEIDRAIAAPGGPPSRIDQLLARAKALYGSRDKYREAAEAYEQAAQIRGPHVPQALYFAAKAWSRADDNDRGLELYGKVIRLHATSPWAERASYFAPRLQRFQRRWPLAEKGYRAYLQRYPRGGFAKEARYELALCLLLAGNHKGARQAFEKLAKEEKEAFDATSYRYLAAVAAHAQGKTSEAAATWRDMVSSQPLSWFALVAAARLSSIGQVPPTPVPPAPPISSTQPLHVQLPPHVSLLRDIGLVRDAEEQMRSQEDSFSRAWGERGGEALCHAYDQLHTGGRLYRVGQRHVPVRLVQMAPTPANRWAWDCLYPHPYDTLTGRLEDQQNIPSELLHAIMRQESAFDPTALSPVGAQGLMQLMPKTAAKTAERMGKPFDPNLVVSPGLNITLGAHYLTQLLHMLQNNVPLAAGAYNAGPAAVGRWLTGAEDIPLDVWTALVPYRETRHYIWRVVGNWARYRYLARGEAGIPVIDLHLPSGVRIPDDAY